MKKAIALLALTAACSSSLPETSRPTTPASEPPASEPLAPVMPPLKDVHQRGYASWYGKALAGHPTASGEIFDPSKMTAAHRTLKLGTWLEVRRTDNGRTVRVKVNDRGPVSHRFIIDLSSGAARRLGMLRMGVAPVELRIIPPP